MNWFSQVRQFLSGARIDPTSKPPFFLSIRSSTTFIVITVTLAVFTDIFFYGLITPVLPFALPQQTGISQDRVQQWLSILLAAYSAALLIASPISGFYADHSSSRRWPMILGLLALAGSTFLLAFGRSTGLFILGRILQGASSAVVWSVGCALLVDTMGNKAGVAMGYVSISMSLGLLLSPLIGGIVYNAAGYQAVYYVAFAIVGLDIVLRFAMIEKKIAKQWIDEDPTVSITADASEETGSPAVTVDQKTIRDAPNSSTPEEGQTPSGSDVEAAIGQQDRNEERQERPEVVSKTRGILVLIKSPRLLAALYGCVVESGILLGFDTVLALFVERAYGWNSMDVGLLLLALFVPGFIAPLAGWLADRYGARWPSFFGFVVTVPTLVSLRFVAENDLRHKILLGFLLGILGVVLPFSMTPLMAEISYTIEAEEAKSPGVFGENGALGLGYGLFNVAFALGGIIGPIWAGYVVDQAGWGTLNWSFAIWSASAAVVVLIWSKNRDKKVASPDQVLEESREEDC